MRRRGQAALLLPSTLRRKFPRLRTWVDIVMQCFVYASLHKADTYLWLAERDAFDLLPEPLALMLGELRFVMEVHLDEQRKLPGQDTRQVLDHLRTTGWHLQLPPNETLAAANQLDYKRNLHDDHDA